MGLDVVRAESVRRAAELLAADPGARFLGGGTLAVRDVNCGDVSITRLVLSDGLGLDAIRIEGSRAEIGAAVTMAKIAGQPALAFLHPVAHEIGGPAVRAMATVGGNLFANYPYGDFTVALLALDASVTVEGVDGAESVGLESFLVHRGHAPARIVRSISFELPPANAFRFVKAVRRKPHGASVVSIAAVLPMVAGKVAGACVAYGAMAPTAIRARGVEQALEGRALDVQAIDAARKVATAGCTPRTDPFASDWYRLSVLPVHLARLLES